MLGVACAARPVVATEVGGVSDIVQDGRNGYLVNPKDDEEFAKKLPDIPDSVLRGLGLILMVSKLAPKVIYSSYYEKMGLFRDSAFRQFAYWQLSGCNQTMGGYLRGL